MSRFALLDAAGVVVENVAEAATAADLPPGVIAVALAPAQPCEVGWIDAGGGVFVPPKPTLDQAKQSKLAEIATKSGQLLAEGFEFLLLRFALDDAAQVELARLDQYKAVLPFPFSYADASGLAAIKLATVLDVDAFTLPAFKRVGQVQTEGSALGDQVRACVTVAQVEAIQDTRT